MRWLAPEARAATLEEADADMAGVFVTLHRGELFQHIVSHIEFRSE